MKISESTNRFFFFFFSFSSKSIISRRWIMNIEIFIPGLWHYCISFFFCFFRRKSLPSPLRIIWVEVRIFLVEYRFFFSPREKKDMFLHVSYNPFGVIVEVPSIENSKIRSSIKNHLKRWITWCIAKVCPLSCEISKIYNAINQTCITRKFSPARIIPRLKRLVENLWTYVPIQFDHCEIPTGIFTTEKFAASK